MSEPQHEYRDLNELTRHPLNQDVYGDLTLEPDFIDSIEQHGVLEPILIKSDGTIISGHRRYAAALEIGLDQVPVREVSYDSELKEREAVIHHNKQRTKTFSQKMREAMELEKIEQERATERQGERTDIKQTFASSEFGQTRDKVASELKMSGETYRKAKKVWTAAQEHEKIQKQVELIDAGEQSITGAKRALDRWKRRQKLEGDVDWADARDAMAVDKIGRRQDTFKDSSEVLSDEDDWNDMLHTILDEHADRWSNFDQGDAYVFAYMLEAKGFADFSQSGDAGEPTSFVGQKPDEEALWDLYWGDDNEEGMILEEIALRFGVDVELVKHWLFEENVPLKKQELTEIERQRLG
jgi:ParB family chromosome partitioning protein